MRACGQAEITFLATEGFALALGLPNVLFVGGVYIFGFVAVFFRVLANDCNKQRFGYF